MAEPQAHRPPLGRPEDRTLAQSLAIAAVMMAFLTVCFGVMGGVVSRYAGALGLIVGLASSIITGPMAAMTLTTPPRVLSFGGRAAMFLYFVALTAGSLVGFHVLTFAVVTLLHDEADASVGVAFQLGWTFFRTVMRVPGSTSILVVLGVIIALGAWLRSMRLLRGEHS